MHIEPFREMFRESVIQLWEDCGLIRPWNNPNKDIDRKLKINPELFLLAVDNEKVFGSAMGGYEGHRGWISYLAVAPSSQRQKVGSLLVSTLEDKLKGIGCPKINLQIRSDNQSVINFYRSIGYESDEVISMGKRLIPDN